MKTLDQKEGRVFDKSVRAKTVKKEEATAIGGDQKSRGNVKKKQKGGAKRSRPWLNFPKKRKNKID